MPTTLSFLAQVAQRIHASKEDPGRSHDLSNTLLLLPTHHAGHTLLGHLARLQGKAHWAPTVHTLSSWIDRLYPLHRPSQLTLLAHLYEVARAHPIPVKTFETFVPWGKRILHDFTTLDQGLVPVEKLFAIPHTVQELSALPEAARDFWQALPHQEETQWLALWKMLPTLYQQYTAHLLSQQIAYSGLQQRKVYEALHAGRLSKPAYQRIIGVGLHTLTPAQEAIFSLLSEQMPVSFFWDTDPYYTSAASDHPAGHYFRQRHAGRHALHDVHITPAPPPSPPVVETIAAQEVSSQPQAVRQAIDQLIAEKGATAITGNIAVVLPDPGLLLPLIHALPTTLGDLQVRIGYPLASTPAYQLLIALLRFQIAWQSAQGLVTDPLLQAVQTVLAHPYLSGIAPEVRKQLIETTTLQPQTLPSQARALGTLAPCLQPLPDKKPIFHPVTQCLRQVQAAYQSNDAVQTWEKVAMKATLELWHSLTHAWPAQQSPTHVSEELLRILSSTAQGKRLSMATTSSTQGIEIMGLHDTLSLDFDYIFLLSANEGTLPPPATRTSTIPYLLQKAYDLPQEETYEARDAYPFYRLLHRAKKVYCTCTASGGEVGERSHYLYELAYRRGWTLQEKQLHPSLTLLPAQQISIPKNAPVIEQLETFLINEHTTPRALSPSAINTYLDCPFHFYLQYLARLKPPRHIGTEVDAALFGQLFHEVMERLYRPHVGETITQPLIKRLQQKVPTKVAHAYQACVHHTTEVRGTDLIIKKVLARLALQILSLDSAYAPFTLVALELGREHPLTHPFTLSNGHQVLLGGIIDRVDKKGDLLRIVDYKTGGWTRKIPSIESLFEPAMPTRNKVALQLLWYGWLYKKHHNLSQGMRVMPAVISTRAAWEVGHTASFTISGADAPLPLTDMAPYITTFETHLRHLLDRLFDPHIPFAQTDSIPLLRNSPYQALSL